MLGQASHLVPGHGPLQADFTAPFSESPADQPAGSGMFGGDLVLHSGRRQEHRFVTKSRQPLDEFRFTSHRITLSTGPDVFIEKNARLENSSAYGHVRAHGPERLRRPFRKLRVTDAVGPTSKVGV